MSSRTRGEGEPPSAADPTAKWMTEVTVGMVTHSGRIGAMEKSVDGLKGEVRASTEAAKAAVAALERIAKAEEERNRNEKDAAKARERWAERIWSSQPFQLLLLGIASAVVQLMGVAYIAHSIAGGTGAQPP